MAALGQKQTSAIAELIALRNARPATQALGLYPDVSAGSGRPTERILANMVGSAEELHSLALRCD